MSVKEPAFTCEGCKVKYNIDYCGGYTGIIPSKAWCRDCFPQAYRKAKEKAEKHLFVGKEFRRDK